MFRDQIDFGINSNCGHPYVNTCRGTVGFKNVEEAADFIRARALARLSGYHTIWDSFTTDVATNNGYLDNDNETADTSDIPF